MHRSDSRAIPDPALARRRLLGAVLIVALMLRLLPIGWGLPLSRYTGFYHPDEPEVYNTVLGFPANYLASNEFRYGTAYQYTIGILLLPIKLLVVRIPVLGANYKLIVILACRLMSVALGTATVYLGYRLGRRLFDDRVGLLTAAYTAVSLYLCLNSPFATLDVTMAFLVVANLLLCLRAIEQPNTRRVAAAGLAFGYLLATKISAIVFLAVPALLAAASPTVRTMRLGVAYFGAAGVVFATTTPQVLLHVRQYLEFMRAQKAEWLDRYPTTWTGMSRLWWSIGTGVLGVPIVLLAIVGSVPWRRQRGPELALLLFSAASLALFRGFLQPRFVIPVAPFVCLFAAAGSAWLLTRQAVVVRVAGALVIVIALGHSLARVSGGIYMRARDPRTLAAQYLDRIAPAHASIALAYATEEDERQRVRWQYPTIDSTKYRLVSVFDDPDFVVASSDGYGRIEALLRSHKLLPGYVVAPEYRGEWWQSSPPSPRRLYFFDSLLKRGDSGYELAAEFPLALAIPIDMGGYTIRIYRRGRPLS